LILYDQVGCGRSTHLRSKNGDENFWSVQLFLDELNNVISHFKLKSYDIFGHSWGGMLASEHAITNPLGLRRLILADSLAAMTDWVRAAGKLRSKLPQEVQEILKKHEKDGTTDSVDYEAAMQVFYKKHVCRLDPWPEDVIQTFQNISDDDTVYKTMLGPSEFFVTGNLKDWSVKGKLGKIDVPTMLLNGRFDEATDDVVLPFWEEIGKVRWFTFAESSHMPHWEERDKLMKVVAGFLGA
jgi:proline-specific peptidase